MRLGLFKIDAIIVQHWYILLLFGKDTTLSLILAVA